MHRIKLVHGERRLDKARAAAQMWTASAVVMIRVMLATSWTWPVSGEASGEDLANTMRLREMQEAKRDNESNAECQSSVHRHISPFVFVL